MSVAIIGFIFTRGGRGGVGCWSRPVSQETQAAFDNAVQKFRWGVFGKHGAYVHSVQEALVTVIP